MKLLSRRARLAAVSALRASIFSCALLVVGGANVTAHAQEEKKSQPPATPNALDVRPEPVAIEAETLPAQKTLQRTPRELRAQAYTKLLEGQRYLAGARNGDLPAAALRSAQQAFQKAAELDPTLAEARTALAEISFFFLRDLDQAELDAVAATRIDPDNIGAHRILSRIYFLKSGFNENNLDRAYVDRAVVELREITRINPNDAEALALLGEFYEATGRESEAIDAFRRWMAVPAAPSPAEARFYNLITKGRELTPDAAAARLAKALLQAGRTSEAIEAVRRAIALNAENPQHLELLDDALAASGSSENRGVLPELQQMVAANPTNTAAVVLLARSQSRAGRIDDAVAVLRSAIAKSVDSGRPEIELRATLAEILTEALRYDEAITVYEELLKERGIGSTPLTSNSQKQFALVVLQSIVGLHRQAGRVDQALATVERLRRVLGTDDPNADLQLISLLREQGKRREALDAARAARLRHPNQPAFVRLEAQTLAEFGRVDEAAAMLRARLKGAPEEDYTEYLTIASLYIEAGRGREAVEAARKALELAAPDQPARVTGALLMLSSAQERAGDVKGSEESLRRILAKDPNNATALNNLGYFLVERNERLTEALEMIQRAVREEPGNASFLDSLGWVYFKLSKFDEAERYLSDAARRNPASATIHEHLGDLYQHRGKADQARAAWQKALSLSIEASGKDRIKAKLGGKVGSK